MQQTKFFGVFMGPPGSGKGTQADAVIREMDAKICHVSTGDLLREEIRMGTSAGIRAKSIMESGGLVPDELVFEVFENRLKTQGAKDGIILDGFPRTVAQAEQLQALLKRRGEVLDAVILFEVPEELLVKRISGRQVHLTSGRTYHDEFNPPKEKGKDDVTGEPLQQRADDTPETLIKRLKTYAVWTETVIHHFERENILYHVNGANDPKSVTKDVMKIIRDVASRRRELA